MCKHSKSDMHYKYSCPESKMWCTPDHSLLNWTLIKLACSWRTDKWLHYQIRTVWLNLSQQVQHRWANMCESPYYMVMFAYLLHWNSVVAWKLPTAYRAWSSPLPSTWAWELYHRHCQDDSQPLPPSPPVANVSNGHIQGPVQCCAKMHSTRLNLSAYKILT